MKKVRVPNTDCVEEKDVGGSRCCYSPSDKIKGNGCTEDTRWGQNNACPCYGELRGRSGDRTYTAIQGALMSISLWALEFTTYAVQDKTQHKHLGRIDWPSIISAETPLSERQKRYIHRIIFTPVPLGTSGEAQDKPFKIMIVLHKIVASEHA